MISVIIVTITEILITVIVIAVLIIVVIYLEHWSQIVALTGLALRNYCLGSLYTVGADMGTGRYCILQVDTP